MLFFVLATDLNANNGQPYLKSGLFQPLGEKGLIKRLMYINFHNVLKMAKQMYRTLNVLSSHLAAFYYL